MDQNSYQILGISPSASNDEIKARYRFLSFAFHPDRFNSEEQRIIAEEEFKRISSAYQSLISKEQKTAEHASPQQAPQKSSVQEQSCHPVAAPEKPQSDSSSEWTEEDTVKMRNGARFFGRILIVPLVGLALYIAGSMFRDHDSVVGCIAAILALWLVVIFVLILKPNKTPPIFIRIATRLTLLSIGIPLFLVGLSELLDGERGWLNYTYLTFGMALMIIARGLFEPETVFGLGRALFRGAVFLKIIVMLWNHDYKWSAGLVGILLILTLILGQSDSESQEEEEVSVPEQKMRSQQRRVQPDSDSDDSSSSASFWKGVATGAAASFAAKVTEDIHRKSERFTCKYCGREESSVFSLTSGQCRKSSNGHHVPYEGEAKRKYCCKYCGREESSIFSLTCGQCRKSSNEHHVPYEGEAKRKYCCKYCGREESSVFSLTNGQCRKSFNGHHVPRR